MLMPDPGSDFIPSWIPDPGSTSNLSFLTQKIVFKLGNMIRAVHPGS
jgi:hypothetical protein